MRYSENVQQILELKPDYMGFIFYKKSPRYVGDGWDGPGKGFPVTTKKIGVFVDEPADDIRLLADQYRFDYLQLHGHESPHYCKELKEEGYNLIKTVSLKKIDDLEVLGEFEPWVKYFLFDTPSKKYGGTGTTFDWSLLAAYNHKVPIFLSGGISLENLIEVKTLKGLNLEAIDVNSRFEVRPAWKDPALLAQLKNQIEEL